jgi:hypothetical protein
MRASPAAAAAIQIRVAAERAAGFQPLSVSGMVSTSGAVCGPYM